MQRTQAKGASAAPYHAPGHESDKEQDEGQDEPPEHCFSRSLDQRDVLEEEDEEDEEEHSRASEACSWSHNSYSFGRAFSTEQACTSQSRAFSSEPCTSQSETCSPPSHRPPPRFSREHREAVAQQQALVLQSTKHAQIVKTNQHMSSKQSKGQYAPSSPLPSRHLSSALKPGPGIDISPLGTPADEPVYENRMVMAAAAMGYSCDESLLREPSYCSSSKPSVQDRLCSLSASSFDGPANSGPIAQGNHSEAVRDGTGGGNMRVSSSTSSLASSSSLSDSGKLGPDVRNKVPDKKQSQGPSAEYKPRPFMGITDKTARFQQQHSVPSPHQAHSWYPLQPIPSDMLCHNMAPNDCEPYAKTVSTYQDQHKPGPHVAMAMSSLQNGNHDFTDKFCSATNCYKESKPPVALPHAYMDKPKPGLVRENPAIHVASIKPKRSFIESNV